MKKFTPFNTFVATCFLLFSFSLSAQNSNKAAFDAAIQEAINSGQFEGFQCGITDNKEIVATEKMVCNQLGDGFGTNGWQPTSNAGGNNIDPACAVPATSFPADNGGNLRIPINIIIFECGSWTDANYTCFGTCTGSELGFEALTDTDLNAKLADVNAYYAEANVEFYEIARQRITDCDLYDYYRGTDPGTGNNDGISDVTERSAYDIANVLNLYFVGGIDGDHDCCGTAGFAFLPPGPQYSIMRYGAGISGTTLEHEIGHFLGLYHTHNTTPGASGEENGTPAGALDNSDCLTTGDGICDTWPDPNFSHQCANAACNGVDSYCYISDVGARCDFDDAGYLCQNGSSLTISPNSGTAISTTTSTILADNIMSYNLYGGCRTHFSPCQYDKINTMLTNSGCRNDMCYTEASQYFQSMDVNNVNSPLQEICIGESIPALNPGLTVTKFDGSTYALDKFFFFANESDMMAAALNGTASASYTPTAAQVDVSTPGDYSIWIAEANAYADPPCKVEAKITVLPNSGDATPASIAASGNTTVNLTTSSTSLDADQIIGWWVRSSSAILSSSFADQAALDAALASATNGGTVMNNPDNIFASTTGSPATDFSLAMDCNTLDNGVTYFATPFISNSVAAVADAICNDVYNGGGVTFNGNQGGSRMIIAPGSVSCAPASPPNLPTFSVDVNVTAYGGNTATHNIWLTDYGVTQIYATISGSGVGTYTFNQADFPANFDPNVSGFRIYSYDSTSGSTNAGVIANAVLNITYPGTPAVAFPDVALNDCAFGNPISITCSAALPVELLSFRGEQNKDQIDLFWNTANEQNNDFFTLEKADENGVFHEIAVVKGAGTTDENQYYNETDFQPYLGQNLYRLKQTDFDGKTTTSAVVSINFKANETVDFFPNPVRNGAFTLQYLTDKNPGQAQLEIFTLNGQTLHAETLVVETGSNFYDIQVNQLPKGVYLARIINGNSVHTFKLTNVQ